MVHPSREGALVADVPEADVDPQVLTERVSDALAFHENERAHVDWFGASPEAAKSRRTLGGESPLRQALKFLARLLAGEEDADAADWGAGEKQEKLKRWAFDRFVRAASDHMRVTVRTDESLLRAALDLFRINALMDRERRADGVQTESLESLVMGLADQGFSNEEIAKAAGMEVADVDAVYTRAKLAKVGA